MSRTWTLVAIVAAVAGCGGSSVPDGQTGAAAAGAQCRHAAGIGDGMPGSCGAGRAALDCTFPNGAGCECITDNASCDGCGTGATCTNKCNANEYAASCGGGPGPGDPSITYADPPAGCRLGLATPAGAFYCCPCL